MTGPALGPDQLAEEEEPLPTSCEWGWVDPDGSVYVRAGDGARQVGSWQAGPPGEGLAYYQRRFEQLATETALLEQRLSIGAGPASRVVAAAEKLAGLLPAAAAVGDLTGLAARVERLRERAAAAATEQLAIRTAQRAAASAEREALAAEAEQLANSSDWKAAGDRLHLISAQLLRLPSAGGAADTAVKVRVDAAWEQFRSRRNQHFSALELQRSGSRERKEALVAQAESLATSTDWRPTADRFRALMADWKSAGRAGRDADDQLWLRFKTAQDAFFAARSVALGGAAEEERANEQAKLALLAEAERLDPADPAARRRLRELEDRWDKVGRVPRQSVKTFTARFAAVQDRIRAASSPARPTESAFAATFRARVSELEDKLARARAAGRPTEELERQLAAQRQWLGAAAPSPEPAATESAGPEPPSRPDKGRSTSAWVRAAD